MFDCWEAERDGARRTKIKIKDKSNKWRRQTKEVRRKTKRQLQIKIKKESYGNVWNE